MWVAGELGCMGCQHFSAMLYLVCLSLWIRFYCLGPLLGDVHREWKHKAITHMLTR